MGRGWIIPVLVCLAGWGLLGRGALPLAEPEEARYAEIPRQMLTQGQWLVPVFDGQAYLDKPPLLYWLVMSSFDCLGTSLEAARLVPTLASIGTVLVVWWWARRVAGGWAGVVAAGVLLSMPGYVLYGPMLTMNGLLGLFVTAALAMGCQAMRGAAWSWRWWLGSAVLCGLGLLAKGPVALAVVAVPLFGLPWLLRWPVRPGLGAIVGYLVGALAVFVPWLVGVAVREPEFLEYFLWHHHVERALMPFDHSGPWWYYLPELGWGTLPWTVVLVMAGRDWWRGRAVFPGVAWFALGTCLWMPLVFSLSGSKRHLYLVPLYPPLAVAVGVLLAERVRDMAGSVLVGRQRAWLGVAASVVVGIIIWRAVGIPQHHQHFGIEDVLATAGRRCDLARLPIYCYPHSWPTIPFRLARNDVVSFSVEREQMLYSELTHENHAVVFVKPSLLERVRRNLHEGLRAEEVAGNLRVAVLLVTREPGGATDAVAKRNRDPERDPGEPR